MTKQGFGKLASLEEAKQVLFSLVKEMSDEEVPLTESLGRTISKDIVAPIDVPHFSKSAMDGFAVRAQDTFGASQTKPGVFNIIDSITAGIISKSKPEKDQCIEITTGAPMPDGADGVVMVEYTEKNKDQLTIYKGVAPGDNIVKKGSDIKKDELVIKKGSVLTSRLIGVVSALGISKVSVKKRPIIAYFSTGNEILDTNEKLLPGKVFDINSHTILNAAREQDCELIDLGVVKDDLDLIKDTVTKGTEQADFVLLSGGSSLGGEDFMVEAVQKLGQVLIHGIAVKPGKPVLVGKVNGKLVLGLPGYPTSALSNFYILVVPLINKMLGKETKRLYVTKLLSRKIASTIGRYEFLAVRIEGNQAVPVMKGSSSITTLSESDGFLEIGENTEVLNKGDEVRVMLF